MTATTSSARLITTLAAPLDPAEADAPSVLRWPDQRLLVQRGDTELVAYDLDELKSGTGEPTATRFPAPWPRRFGTSTVAPRRDLAVFAGVHALRAVDAMGAVRWEIPHGCWEHSCRAMHTSLDDYAQSPDHRYPSSGSAVFSADGSILWAHVRGPLAVDEKSEDLTDEWLVLDAADGRVLGRLDTQTTASNSRHRPHPSPGQMGLGVNMGQDGQPLLWGHWNGNVLTVDRIGEDDRVLLAVSPSGDRFLTVTHEQDSLALHRVTDGSIVAELEAETVTPHYDDPDEVWWDYHGSFLEAQTVITGTTDADLGTELHWLVDAGRMRVTDQITYPFPISGTPEALGDGTWYTVSEAGDALHLWTLQP
ncbi:hypothetical protein [Kitasatospora aureofaciens]|uniref:hypothetical protein n=1 Tax=Kitasatospora aureofaciens TaxID=1894 RepID=UPI001C48A93E|nr:hypothetical protein [Kitasatospora aureofaciens]MBV6702324.1 hypothetical protein [Kitasatospora aureofaciens]